MRIWLGTLEPPQEVKHRQDARSLAFAYLTVVFAQRDIAPPVESVFNKPCIYNKDMLCFYQEMWKGPDRMTDANQRQPYDSALKSLMDDQAAEMLPEILPECTLLGEQNAEIARTNLRPDLVYLIQYRGLHHILNLELQTNTDSDMAYRMLLYHVELFGKYRLPVISMVMYPFETSLTEPVFSEESGSEILLEFHHRVLRLWSLEAEQYVRKRVVSMYTLLPAMKGVNASLLLQAIDEMELKYTRTGFVRHLVRFRTILRRSMTLSIQDKQIVEDHMDITYDSLLDEDPEIQERVAKAEIVGQQKAVLDFIEVKFPSLVQVAREQVVRLNNPEELSRLMKQIALAPDEATVRWVLGTFVA